MYLMGLITIISSIACLAIDISDNDDAFRLDPLGASHSFTNFILAIYMISTTIPLMMHFSHHRLMYIIIFINLSILFLIIRWAFSRRFHPELILSILLNIPVSIIYAAYVYRETPKTKKSTMANILHIIISDEIEVIHPSRKVSSSSLSKRKSSLQVLSKQRHSPSGNVDDAGKMAAIIRE